MTMPSPSAVPAGNNLGTRDTSRRAIEERGGMQREKMPLLAARAVHVSPVGHAHRHKNLHHLD